MTVQEAIDKLSKFPEDASLKTIGPSGEHVPVRFVFKASSEEQTIVIL